MADDIDIEEHDVLDNPHIKDIFPDITNIKTEVIDYENEEYLDFDNDNYGTPRYETGSEYIGDDIPSLYQNRIVLGTRPSASGTSSDDESETVPELLETVVVLEDWGVLLENNPCYCRSCQILFPTENALDSHKMSAHSLLVAVGRNKAIKSTSKSSISARLKFESDVDDLNDHLCNHCNVVFPDQNALLKHSYELLPRKFACDFCDLLFDSEMSRKIHMIIHSNAECYRCPICSCYFKYVNKLINHLRYQHGTELAVAPERVMTNYKCAFCPAKFKNNKSYNGHIFYHHSEFYKKNDVTVKCDKFQCFPCNLTFPSTYSERIHRATQHASAKSNDVPNQMIAIDKKIKLEPLSTKKETPLKIDLTQRPIPRSTLFKCNQCQLHFVSCLVAVEHTKRCVLQKGEWKCKQCRRTFKFVDRENHITQHKSTDRFKVIKIEENTLNKLLCLCKTCNICFDEKTLLKYHINGCTETMSLLCNICNIRVHEHAITKHKRLHNELGTEQFVVVDYASFDQLSTEKANTEIEVKKKNTHFHKKEKFYYYCPTCQCFMKINKISDKHDIGKCNKYLQKSICKLCGLKFSANSITTHKKEHKTFPSLKLRDLTFKNTQTLKKINPPFPDFKKCKNCNVKFFSGMALKSHVCDVEEAKICGYCGEKFSDLAYKLHVPFHEYSGSEKKKVFSENIPELIKKYESLKIVWNILYLCEICDTILDDYDEVVEHCQNHFCNMESYNVTINRCSICDFQIVSNCYEKHKQLHLTNSVTKSSFKILRYNYDRLLTEEWFNIFNALAKEQVDQILNKSKYKYTRSVRMELLVDGSIDLTLYQCVLCEIVVDKNAVAEHCQNSLNCVNPTKYTCPTCHISFKTITSLNSHAYLHENLVITNKTFRIISFNDKKDLFINDSLRSKLNPESLKFIRCQHCGKLINKSKYRKHVEYHTYIAKKKNQYMSKDKRKNQPKFLIRSKFKNDLIKSHNFYKCKKCAVCVFRNNVAKHYCSTSKQKKSCPKCDLYFRSSHLYKHLMYHDKFKLTKNNMNVFVFKNGKIEKEFRKEDQVILYQCSDCAVCLHKEMNIKRHICISDNYQKVCRLCEMPFHCSRMQIHEKFHEDKNFSRNNILIKKFKSKDVLKSKPLSINKYTNMKSIARSFKISKNHPRTENIDPQYVRYAHLRKFKCTQCKLLFVTPSALLKHISCCSSDNVGVKCDSCALIFHKSSINLHKSFQKCDPRTRNAYYFIITSDVKNGIIYDDERWEDFKCLYNCINCGIHFTSFKALFNHVRSGHLITIKLSTCDICNILMSCQSFVRHKKIHHDNNLSLSDLIKFDVNFETLNKTLTDVPCSESVNIIDYYSKSIDEENVQMPVNKKICIEEDVSKNHIELNTDNLENATQSLMNEFHHCNICQLNFLHIKSLKRHIHTGLHNEKKISCPKCKLLFTQMSLTRHLKLHHDTNEYTPTKHFEPNEANVSLNKTLRCVSNSNMANVSDIDQDESVDDDIQVAVKRKSCVEGDVPKKTRLNTRVSENTKSNRITTNRSFMDDIFHCDICDLNFLHIRTIELHMSIGRHNERQFVCPECGLTFTQNSLTRHLKLHHATVDWTNTTHRKTVRPKVRQVAIVDGDEKQIEKPIAKENITETDTNKHKNNTTKKLYKCSECDVYFTLPDACHDHMASHVALDPTEYIACKLCDLQFLCEYLGSHMKCHREKTFSIDDLIVEEYHVDNGKIRIDTYSAADRLKSKLVTTTTHFDTEEEKNEIDESTIESTVSVTESKGNYRNSVNSNEHTSHMVDGTGNKK